MAALESFTLDEKKFLQYVQDKELNKILQDCMVYRKSTCGSFSQQAIDSYELSDYMILPKQVGRQRLLLQELIDKFPLLGSSNADAALYKCSIFAQWWKKSFGSKLDVSHTDDLWKLRDAPKLEPVRAVMGRMAATHDVPVRLSRPKPAAVVVDPRFTELEEKMKRMEELEARLARFEAIASQEIPEEEAEEVADDA
jgi:hypothetical protein